jgi:hypothetical protein
MRLSGWHLLSSQAASRRIFNDKSISFITLLVSCDARAAKYRDAPRVAVAVFMMAGGLGSNDRAKTRSGAGLDCGVRRRVAQNYKQK